MNFILKIKIDYNYLKKVSKDITFREIQNILNDYK